MAATLKGFRTNEIKPQPGFNPKQNENGGWQGTHRFAMTRDALNNSALRLRFKKGVSVVSLDPDVPTYFGFMTLNSTSVRFEEGNICMVEADFAGAEGAQYGGDGGGLTGTAEPTYSLGTGQSEYPVSSHPKWVALTNTEKIVLGYIIEGNYKWDLENQRVGVLQEDGSIANNSTLTDAMGEIARQFADRVSQGHSTYIVQVLTWTERTEGKAGLTAAQLNSLGRVSTPRGNPPTPTGDRNWKLTSASQDQTGTKFTTFLEWTLSDRGGWDEFFYDD